VVGGGDKKRGWGGNPPAPFLAWVRTG